jgi:hypothetical protein
VRRKGIVEEQWFGSLLEQYAGFLNWFKREFDGRYWHGLPWEMVRRFKKEEISADFADYTDCKRDRRSNGDPS